MVLYSPFIVSAVKIVFGPILGVYTPPVHGAVKHVAHHAVRHVHDAAY